MGVSVLADDADGFAQFYELIYGRELPRHARSEWIEPLFRARAAGKGLVVEAFRGSSKTTTLSIAFTAFRIGQEPHKSALLVQASDEMATDTAAQIADLIARSPGWQVAFPQVAPDPKAGWGAPGYEVKRVDLDYAEWRGTCAREKGKDPSFVGLGYRSRAIIGKHPTGLLLVDDIHDENNTRSLRELDMVIKILTGTILPTVTPETWQLFVGTPWRDNDALAYLKSTGRFMAAATPIRRKRKSQWSAKFPKKEIDKLQKLTGEAEFARMYMLDLKAAEGIHLKREWLHEYPHEKISPQWPVVMGVDYASTADELRSSRRDYFAVAIGRALPGGGGIVLVDGFRGQVSQGEAEQQLKALAAVYPTTQIVGVEAVGKGEEFYHLLVRTSLLPIIPMQPGGQSKGKRFEVGMAPLFQFGRAWVADVETPFLRAFRDEWLAWPNGEHDDTLDAVHWMLFAARHHLVGNATTSRAVGERKENPFGSLGRN